MPSMLTNSAEPLSRDETLVNISSREIVSWGVAQTRLLWERKKILLRTALVGLLVGLIVATLFPPDYESYARLMPPEDKSTAGLALISSLANRSGAGMSGFASEFLGVKTTGALFMGILTSRTVQTDLVDRFELQRIYGVRRASTARAELSRHTGLSEDRRSGIITISVADESPRRAAAMAREYVEELNRVVTQLSSSSAQREREFLEGRLAAVKQDLESAETEFSQFASNSGAIDIKEQGKAMVEAAAALQGQLIAAQSQLEGLKEIYSGNNVRVLSVQARVAELQHQLERLSGGASVRDTGAGSDHSFYPSIRKLPLLGVSYADLYRKTKIEEAVFETLTQEYELAKVEEVKQIPSVKVLDPPDIPDVRGFPPKILLIVLSGMLFFGIGIVVVYGKSFWQGIDASHPVKVLANEVIVTSKNAVLSVRQHGGFHKKGRAREPRSLGFD